MQGQIGGVNGFVVIIFGHYILSDKSDLELEIGTGPLHLDCWMQVLKAVKGTRVMVYRALRPAERASSEVGYHPGPEALSGQVGVNMEHLPLPGQLVQ